MSENEKLTELPGYIKILQKLNKDIEEKNKSGYNHKITKFC